MTTIQIRPYKRESDELGNVSMQYGRPKPEAASRSFGPACPCHGRRNMQRMGYCLYRCQESGETFQLMVHDGHIAMVPLPQAEAMEAIK